MTKVIFRKFAEGDIIAVFPEHAGDFNPSRTCGCYQHTGQHGAITLDFARFTEPATESEYSDLKNELEGIGYSLSIKKRMDFKSALKARESYFHGL